MPQEKVPQKKDKSKVRKNQKLLEGQDRLYGMNSGRQKWVWDLSWDPGGWGARGLGQGSWGPGILGGWDSGGLGELEDWGLGVWGLGVRGTAETRLAQAKVWGKKVSRNLEKVKTEFDLEVQRATSLNTPSAENGKGLQSPSQTGS